MQVRLIAAGAVVLALAGSATALAISRPAGSGHVATIGSSGQSAANLSVVSGAVSLTIRAGAMPGTLVRASTPGDSAVRPELSLTRGTVRLRMTGTGHGGPDAVTVELNSGVRWQLRLGGGASQISVLMGNGRLAGIDFTAGVSLVRLTLPRPAGTVTVTLAAGASAMHILVPASVPTRLQLIGGAAQAVLAGRVYTGIAGGTVLTAPGWGSARDRYDLDATSGVAQVTVTG